MKLLLNKDQREAQARYEELESQREHLRGVVEAHERAEKVLADQRETFTATLVLLRDVNTAVVKLPSDLSGSVAMPGDAVTRQSIPDVVWFMRSLIAGTEDGLTRRLENSTMKLGIVVSRLASAREALAKIEDEIKAMEAAS